MTVVSAFLVPGSPLPYLHPENPPWGQIATAYRAVARTLASSRPDAILLYSTQWVAVLDELWQTKPHLVGEHVDENWYEYGDLSYEIHIDVELAEKCVAGTQEIGIPSKSVNYDNFPIDSGTIVANGFLNPSGRIPLIIAANNIYHTFEETINLGSVAAKQAEELKKRVAVVGVGSFSGSVFREEIDVRNDGILSVEDDHCNRRVLACLEQGGDERMLEVITQQATIGKFDMGFKHFAWVFGAMGKRFSGARVHAYGATYGSGAAVVEFML